MQLTFDDDDGYIDLSILGCVIRVDLWEANNRLFQLSEAARDDATAYHESVAKYLKHLGFPEVSHKLADAVAAAVFKAVAEKKGGTGGTDAAGGPPDSPASTD